MMRVRAAAVWSCSSGAISLADTAVPDGSATTSSSSCSTSSPSSVTIELVTASGVSSIVCRIK